MNGLNIIFQICGLAISFLLLYFFHRQDTIGLESEKRFHFFLNAIISCLILDITSIVCIVNQATINRTIVLLVCKAYLISIAAVSFIGLVYTCGDVYAGERAKFHRTHRYVYHWLFLIVAFLIVPAPIYIYHKGDVIYTYGPSCTLTYAICIGFMFCTLYEIIFRGKSMNHKRRKAVVSWMILWLTSALIQFLNPEMLIVGFSSSLGALIIFFEMENPEANINKYSGFFNAMVIKDLLDMYFVRNTPFACMMISFESNSDTEEDRALFTESVTAMVNFLHTLNKAKIFHTADNSFILVCENSNFFENIKFQIKQYMGRSSKTLLPPLYITIPNGHIFNSCGEVLNALQKVSYAEVLAADNNEIELTIDKVATLKHKTDVEEMIVQALEDGQVEVFYQPIYSTKEKSFVSAEALCRIRDRNGNLISPSEFIPIAEETGRIQALGDVILKKSFEFISHLTIRNEGVGYIELNLSVKQCEDPSFPKKILEFAKNAKVNPAMINLEITETASMQKKEAMLANVTKLANYGFSFSLDDFGSGSSNLNYIIDMPVSIVKYDKDLTSAYFKNPKATAVVEHVTKMAHDMGLKVVAEGIETDEQLAVMERIGIDFIQGYYFSRPLPENEYLEFLKSHN